MADPVVKACTADDGTKVLTNVTACQIYILEQGKKYYWTYRLTGTAAPADPTNPTNPRIPSTSEWIEFDKSLDLSFSAAVDVYVWCTGGISGNGQVRVDS